MATSLNNFNTQQDAVMVFLDGVMPGNGVSIEAYIRDAFAEGEFIYEKDISVGGQQLFDILRTKFQSGEIIPMTNNRIVVGIYMELKDLTEEWIDGFFKKAEELRLFVPLNSIFDQHYVIALRCSAGEIRAPGEQERISGLVAKLGKEHPEVSHQVYLLRTAGFAAEFSSQEKAVVQLLHLLTRRDYYSAQAISTRRSLRLIDSADYYTARAENCNRIIHEIDQWHDGATDPDMAQLIAQIRIQMQSASGALQNLVRDFRRRSGVYPVSVKNFEGNFITGYHSTISPNNAIMREIRSEYIGSSRDALVERADMSEIASLVKNNYHYPDYKALEENLRSGRLRAASVDQGAENADEDTKTLFADLYGKAEKVIRESIPDVESIWRKKQLQRTKNIKELALAGRFRDLSDCLLRINDETKPPQIAGVFATELKTTALVCGEPANNWNTRGYEISGIQTAFRYPSITPCEIFVVKESELIDLDDPDAANAMRIIY